jgi:putative colanic acid biosynthesis glycosyltransferase
MSVAPTFSVIVVCKNPGDRLRTALVSIWEQQGANLELIVVDGGSTDGTREWLDTQRAHIATLISEPDRGIYDAMNKGVAATRGEWVYFLGADDRLVTNSVLQEAALFLRQTSAAVVAGEANFEDGRSYRLAPNVRPLARNFVHHQATFYRHVLFREKGGFDSTLAIMADYEFNLRLWVSGVRFDRVPLRIALCGKGGLSDSGGWRGYREEIAVRHRYFSAIRCVLWDILSVARFLRKKAVRSAARTRPDQRPSPARPL